MRLLPMPTLRLMALCVFTAVLAGCARRDCATSAECRGGRVCVHQHTSEIDQDTCEAPCTDPRLNGPDTGCDAGAVCSSGDLHARNDSGGTALFCIP